MAKAAGYMSKAKGNDNQGYVKGNRYGISEIARAPDWITIEEKALHSMGMLIAEVNDHTTQRHGEKFRQSKLLTKEERQKALAAIGNKLAQVRKKIAALPVRCNRYQMTFKKPDFFHVFMAWATGKPFTCEGREEWLPDSPTVAWDTTLPPGSWSSKFREKPRSLWRQKLQDALATTFSCNSPQTNLD
jgi:gluconate kinase